jgi:hypothetical protein
MGGIYYDREENPYTKPGGGDPAGYVPSSPYSGNNSDSCLSAMLVGLGVTLGFAKKLFRIKKSYLLLNEVTKTVSGNNQPKINIGGNSCLERKVEDSDVLKIRGDSSGHDDEGIIGGYKVYKDQKDRDPQDPSDATSDRHYWR